MANRSVDIRTYALVGARARLQELREEADQIRGLFPELRNSARNPVGRGAAGGQEFAAGDGAKPRRPRMISAEGRKRISDAQKARWAARRAAAGSASSTSAPAQKKR